MTVLLKYIDCLLPFPQMLNIPTLQFPITLALCLMFSMIHYAQNYADIIDGFLSESYD